MEREGFSQICDLCRSRRFEDAKFMVGDLLASGKLRFLDAVYASGWVSGYRQALHDAELERRGRRRNPRTP